MNIVVQKICDPYKFFWDVCIVSLGGGHDGGQLRFFSLFMWLRIRKNLVKIILEVHGVEVLPFILGDFAYFIKFYLIKIISLGML